MAFTDEWYRRFLDGLLDRGFRFRTYGEDVDGETVLLRHDVDLSPERALRFAELEADLDVRATYFFLLTSPLYNTFARRTRRVVRRIEALGHDVGLHFSTHQYWETEPPEPVLREAVASKQRALGTVATEPVSVVSFHVPPEWVLRRSFDGLATTYEPRFFDEIEYRADSNQRWRGDPPDASTLPAPVQVLTHPGLWGERDASFARRVETAIASSTDHAEATAREQFLEEVLA